MSNEQYFKITENAKNYQKQQWEGSDDIACFGIPFDDRIAIMSMYEAMAFVASNDLSSMIALRIPKDIFDECQNQEDSDYNFELKDEYFIDYKGKTLI